MVWLVNEFDYTNMDRMVIMLAICRKTCSYNVDCFSL